ncbi:MAG: CPBP family intramembrane metalloprotease [Myxococcota bacterium]|nr:CPBP family intramembrane metalloprotease [Myxococcota bacterium]
MTEPVQPQRSRPLEPEDIFPGPFAAFMLALAGLFAASFVASIAIASGLIERSSITAAMGVGYALGLGGMATLASQRVPQPHSLRLGLQGFSPQILGALLCLLPVVFLVSELDNYWKILMPITPEFEELREEMEALMKPDSPYALAETTTVALGIVPIVEGFFFFGVILQGLVDRLGRLRGLFLTAVLYSLVHFPASGAPGDTLVPLTTWLTLGALMGLARLASGSILPPILLATAFSAIHLAADLGRDSLPIPGFNAPGAHTSGTILIVALISVTLGVRQLWAEALERPFRLPIPEEVPKPTNDDDHSFFP